MADDLSLQAASSMLHMLASRTSSELSAKLMKMQARQAQQMATMLENQAAAIKGTTYGGDGSTSMSPPGVSVDTRV